MVLKHVLLSYPQKYFLEIANDGANQGGGGTFLDQDTVGRTTPILGSKLGTFSAKADKLK